jgi:hypothetical protein
MQDIKINRDKWEAGREMIELLIRSGLMSDKQVEALEHVTERLRVIEDLLDNEPVTIKWSDEHDPDEEEPEPDDGFFKRWMR